MARTSKRKRVGDYPRTEMLDIASLKPHPRNYRSHPDDQLTHIQQSIKAHGVCRNVVVARDGITVLAGHGVVEAARRSGLKVVPGIRLDVDPGSPAALKVLAGDNEVSRLAEQDDRMLADLLLEVKDADLEGLLGTGYDEAMLAAFAMATRPSSEIPDFDAAAHWVGMPEFVPTPKSPVLIVSFRSHEDREEFVRRYEIKTSIASPGKTAWSARWPAWQEDDLSSLKFQGGSEEA